MRTNPLLIAILAALSACKEDTGCLEVAADDATCPAKADLSPSDLFLPNQCGIDIVAIKGEGERTTVGTQIGELEACCYPVLTHDPDPVMQCVVGRPYREGDVQRVADAEGAAVDRVADAWARAAMGEHASIAAFARLSLQLLAHGAPTDLLLAVHEAAADEVAHTEDCLAMARALGADVRPGPFPFHAPLDPRVSLAELAADAAREGCLAETLGAHVAQVAAALAPDPEVREVLTRIAADEAGHAVLSFRIVAWAMAAGGDEVRRAVAAAFAGPAPRIDVDELALRAGVDSAVLAEAARDGVVSVLRPAARALLAA